VTPTIAKNKEVATLSAPQNSFPHSAEISRDHRVTIEKAVALLLCP
jgi:hypothetical protein